jgi:hypothetical protein
MKSLHAHQLMVSVAALLLLPPLGVVAGTAAQAAPSPGPEPRAGATQLRIITTGLPAATKARATITLTAPDGKAQRVNITAGATVELKSAGQYKWNVPNVSTRDAQYAPAQATGTITARAGKTTTLRVTYKRVPQAPQAPSGVTVTPSDSTLNLSWVAPDDGGSPIMGYTATATSSSGEGFVPRNTTGTCTTTATTCTIEGLTNGTRYNITVTARNAIGESTPSRAISGTPARVPDAPTSVTARLATSDSITVSWTAPASNGGSPITRYEVTSQPATQTCTLPVGSTPPFRLECNFTGLTPRTSYTFTATATNAAGTSTASAPSAAVTVVGLPDAPTNATATAGSKKLTVTWLPPANNGGAPIIEYTATASPSGATCTTTSTSCIITGLTNGSTYTVTVTARNSAGRSPASQPSSPATPVQPPFVYQPIGTAVQAPSGMTVTMNSISTVQRTGSVRVTINYTLANNTTNQQLDEGTFKIFFTDGSGEPQYGFFGTLFPGDTRTRSYTWEYLNGKTPLLIEYDADFFGGPQENTLKWQVPAS